MSNPRARYKPKPSGAKPKALKKGNNAQRTIKNSSIGKQKILLVGLNYKSYGLAEILATRTDEEFFLYVYTDGAGSNNKNNQGNGKRQRSSSLGSNGRINNGQNRRGSAIPQQRNRGGQSRQNSGMLKENNYLRNFKRIIKGNPRKRIDFISTNKDLREARGIDYVIFATSADFLESTVGKNIKRAISAYSKGAVWIHLAFNPSLRALSTDYADDNERIRALALPLYTTFKAPAVKMSIDTLDTRLWYDTHPIVLDYPFIDEEKPRKISKLINSFRKYQLYIDGFPRLEKFVMKADKKHENKLMDLVHDGIKRKCVIPLMLKIEFKLYITKLSKNAKGQRNLKDTEREEARINLLVGEAFLELKKYEQRGFQLFSGFSPDDVQILGTVLQRRYLSSQSDNKTSADVVDAVLRINELRKELEYYFKLRPREFVKCRKLFDETDVYAKFKDVRIWR